MFRAAAIAAVTTAFILTSGIANGEEMKAGNAEIQQNHASESTDPAGWYDWKDEALEEVSGSFGAADESAASVAVKTQNVPLGQAVEKAAASADVKTTDGDADGGLWSRLTGAVGAVFGFQSDKDMAAN